VATRDAVSAFQEARGLRVDGTCGEQTWATIVEAGYRLGDRRLYQRKPMTRGDDVADLQRRLGALGFDAGKVDGIFGPDTAGALADFQRNAGLTVDGIFGPDELQVLEGLGQRGEGQIAELRELASLRWSIRTLDRMRIAIGERGGLDGLTTGAGRHLRRRGADAIVLHHPSGADLAQQANAAGAELFLELASLGDIAGCRCAYYQGYRFCSPAGQALAECLATEMVSALGVPALGTSGMTIPVLRETRMPAVVCEVGPTTTLVEHAPLVIQAITASIERWAGTPLA
jgi:N-acetylmuramoyl-L-alanine amidase